MALTKEERRIKIKKRIRKKIFGFSESPRMSVYKSNKHISIQIIDDVKRTTLVSASSKCKEVELVDSDTKSMVAAKVGKLIAKRAIEKGISNVIFDRNGFLYHGRIKSLADAAREAGLKF